MKSRKPANDQLDEAEEPCGLRLLTDPDGRCPEIDPCAWDICLTVKPASPQPWVSVADIDAARSRLMRRLHKNPMAARTLIDLLRWTAGMSRKRRLEEESRVYSRLQCGGEFKQWLTDRVSAPRLMNPVDPVRYDRVGDTVRLVLSDPDSRNAYSASMRDTLIDYLDTCLIDPSKPQVILRGEGSSFCVGGALEEFGFSIPPYAAHELRLKTSAVARLWKLGARVQAQVHGPVIGSGLEIAAAAPRISAASKTWFQLPEITMGLLPGAGGTVTIPDRIGRHRALWMMISGQRLPVRQALEWGLVDAVIPT